ncbi:hypothetical protein [Streptomyces sp. NPDC089919]|uniref:hypothetical protein n=1 Tax=Streptomyces sp. NPDC089919 TaxID=3155188 RepID=UPI003437F887
MVRNALGSLMGLVGATAAVWSPFRAWYDGRHGRDYRLADLLSGTGVSTDKAALLASLFLPFAVAGLLTLVAVVLRSRLVMAVAGVLVLGFTILWMVRQGQAADGLTVGGSGRPALGEGVANAFAGGVFLLLAAVVMRGRRPAHRRVEAAYRPPGEDPSGHVYDSAPQPPTDPAKPPPTPDPATTPPAAGPADAPPTSGPADTPPRGDRPTRPYDTPPPDHGPALGAPTHEHGPSPDDSPHGPPLGPPLNKNTP